ncbi:hypothetical protein Bca52824_072779 [Brassica carinata]|uniref:Lipase n=1 Tax=Brassica carinata TaxID=52824 RepID=A0A8X7Q8R0_BRACI|nr:hypothetical protein Bca52824_072779 [Brassica carinata]
MKWTLICNLPFNANTCPFLCSSFSTKPFKPMDKKHGLFSKSHSHRSRSKSPLCADPATLRARSEGASETIRHTLFGYFSQKTGLLVHLEDSQLTRIQNIGGEAVYWETTINSYLEDYKPVEGIVIAHSGRSVATLLRFGDVSSGYNTKTTMQEAWVIDEIAFNVPGLSMDCFIPPSDLRFDSHVEHLSQGPKIKTLQQGSDR